MGSKSSSAVSSVLKLLYFLLPLCLVLFGAYFFYYHFTVQKKITKTKDDIAVLTKNVHAGLMGQKYKGFDSNFMAFSNYLPFDIIPKESGLGYQIPNRFDGKMIFYEAVGNQQERLLYFGLYKNQKKYKDVYKGVSSYVILFTNLKKQECIAMAQTDWKEISPQFLGQEAAYVNINSQQNGLFNLQNYILTDNQDETKYKTFDTGVVSRKPLTKQEAINACRCKGRNCRFALKFL